MPLLVLPREQFCKAGNILSVANGRILTSKHCFKNICIQKPYGIEINVIKSYTKICNILHLQDQRFAGYCNFPDIRILYLICIFLPHSSILRMSISAFIINTTLFHFLPAPSMTKIKHSRHCTATSCNR
jgi:hypothetical protein